MQYWKRVYMIKYLNLVSLNNSCSIYCSISTPHFHWIFNDIVFTQLQSSLKAPMVQLIWHAYENAALALCALTYFSHVYLRWRCKSRAQQWRHATWCCARTTPGSACAAAAALTAKGKQWRQPVLWIWGSWEARAAWLGRSVLSVLIHKPGWDR